MSREYFCSLRHLFFLYSDGYFPKRLSLQIIHTIDEMKLFCLSCCLFWGMLRVPGFFGIWRSRIMKFSIPKTACIWKSSKVVFGCVGKMVNC